MSYSHAFLSSLVSLYSASARDIRLLFWNNEASDRATLTK